MHKNIKKIELDLFHPPAWSATVTAQTNPSPEGARQFRINAKPSVFSFADYTELSPGNFIHQLLSGEVDNYNLSTDQPVEISLAIRHLDWQILYKIFQEHSWDLQLYLCEGFLLKQSYFPQADTSLPQSGEISDSTPIIYSTQFALTETGLTYTTLNEEQPSPAIPDMSSPTTIAFSSEAPRYFLGKFASLLGDELSLGDLAELASEYALLDSIGLERDAINKQSVIVK